MTDNLPEPQGSISSNDIPAVGRETSSSPAAQAEVPTAGDSDAEAATKSPASSNKETSDKPEDQVTAAGTAGQDPVSDPQADNDEEDDDDDGDDGENEEEGDDEDDEEDEEEDEEPKLKYARLTPNLGPVYRNGDATSAFVVAGDKMVSYQQVSPQKLSCCSPPFLLDYWYS